VQTDWICPAETERFWLWLESSHSVKNVCYVESPTFSTWLKSPKIVTRVESLTRFTLSLDYGHQRSEGGGHCVVALPSDPKNKKCINSFRHCILSVFGSVYEMFNFWRITLFCLEKRLSKHKMTIFFPNLKGGMAPLASPGYAYSLALPSKILCARHWLWYIYGKDNILPKSVY